MRYSTLFPLAAIVAAASPAAADDVVVIHGKVTDAQTGKPVAGASVYRQDTDEVAITDDNGEFAFPPGLGGLAHLAIVDPSYQRADAKTDGTTAVDIVLAPVSLRGDEVVVEADKEHTAAGEAQLHRDEISHVPGARGDIGAAIKNLPGVANTQGFGPQAGLVIRGSSPADSRIFVDGFEIPILYHLGGVTSVLPSEMIDDLVYSPGGFGVEWGKATGGTVQLTSREGAKQLGGFADVSFIHASTLLQGPIGERGSFALSLRRSYIDGVIPLVVRDSSSLSFTALPRYYDYQGRVDYAPADHWKLSAFLFGSDDVFAVSSDSTEATDPGRTGTFSNATRFTRAIASVTYDRPGVYNKLAVSGLTQRVGVDVGTDRYLRVDTDTLTARDEARVKVANGISVMAGGQAELVDFDVRVRFPRPPAEGDPAQPNFTYDPILDTMKTGTGSDLATWAATEVVPTSWLKITGGARLDDFRHNDVVVVQPRVQARAKLADDTALLGAAGLYTRPPDNQDENLQASLKPERAWQSSLGIEQKVMPGVTLQTTAYYVDRTDMIVPREQRGDAMSSDGSDTYINEGIGRSYGAEMLLQARTERFFGWAAYTFARSERRDHPTSNWRMFDEDQTHNLIVLGSIKLGRANQWQVGGRFQYTTGEPYTPVTGAVFESDRNSYSPEYGVVNSQRSSDQHQLDLRVDHLWRFDTWKLSGYVDVSNVYMNAPALGYQYNYNYTKRTEITGIPILPSIGVRGEF